MGTKITITPIAALGTTILALMGLAAYLPGWRLLGSIRPEYVPMAPSTSISFILFSIALLFINSSNRKLLIAVFIILLFATWFSFLEIAGYLANMDLNFENRIVPEFGKLNNVPVARMSPSTGMFFFLVGLSTLLAYKQRLQSKGHLEKWPFHPISSLCQEFLSSEYQTYASGKKSRHASTLGENSHFSRYPNFRLGYVSKKTTISTPLRFLRNEIST